MATEKGKNVNASPAKNASQTAIPAQPAPRKQRVMSAEITAKRAYLAAQSTYNALCADYTAAQGALSKMKGEIGAARTAMEQALLNFERVSGVTPAGPAPDTTAPST